MNSDFIINENYENENNNSEKLEKKHYWISGPKKIKICKMRYLSKKRNSKKRISWMRKLIKIFRISKYSSSN